MCLKRTLSQGSSRFECWRTGRCRLVARRRSLSNRRRSACCRCVDGPTTEHRGGRSVVLPLCRFSYAVTPRQSIIYTWYSPGLPKCTIFGLFFIQAPRQRIRCCRALLPYTLLFGAAGADCYVVLFFVLYVVQLTSTRNCSLRPHASGGNTVRGSLYFRT